MDIPGPRILPISRQSLTVGSCVGPIESNMFSKPLICFWLYLSLVLSINYVWDRGQNAL